MVGIQTIRAPSLIEASTATGFRPPTASFRTTPPNARIPGTVRRTSAARPVVSCSWAL
jgi:hypothetical protein